MSTIDLIIIVIILISALMSIKRGFIREVLSLVIWVVAFGVAMLLHKQVAPLLESYITWPSMRNIAAMGLLFVVTLMLGSVASFMLGSLIKATGLTSTDRLLGVLFGAFRGVLVIAVIVMLSKGLFSKDPWWQDSLFIPYFESLESWIREIGGFLYENIKAGIFGIEALQDAQPGVSDAPGLVNDAGTETIPDISELR